MGKNEILAAALVVCALLACKKNETRTDGQVAASAAGAEPSVQATASAPQALTIPEAPCVLNVADKPKVPIFPTVEAAREWIAAMDKGDWDAAEAARKGERAYLVESGTRCTRLDIDLDVARVRIVTGPRQGDVGWTRREWSFAKGKDD